MIGKTLGHYKITGSLGAGGMGDVYRAHDPKLKRDIAIKVLPEELAADPERRERFEREAIAVAALDHPNIVTVYSVEEADGLHFITMQLVEGKTLSELIPRQGFALEKFFEIAVPLADAIGAAHERGITHRDLKPANVMVAADGRVMVLDFGLAKLMADDADADTATQLATEHLTEEGKILGTVAYMSPEQAEGRAIDHRSDIFSLGILMYEMITGEGPFSGDTKLSVMSSIVRDTPTSITELNPRVPRHLGRIIKQALEKDVSRRSQSVLDVRNQLEELRREVASGEVLPVSAGAGAGAGAGGAGHRTWLIAGAVIAGAVIVGLAELYRGGGSEGTIFTLGEEQSVTSDLGMEEFAAISRDGRFVAYSQLSSEGLQRIYVRQIGGERPIPLTESVESSQTLPRWSPDGDDIAFVGGDGRAYVAPALGGRATPVARPESDDAFIVSVAYSPSGDEIAYATNDPSDTGAIYVKPAEGNGGGRMIADSIVDMAGLAWSPDGRWLAYSAGNGLFYRNRNIAPADLWVISMAEGPQTPIRVTEDLFMNQSPVWMPESDHLLFVSDRGGGLDVYQVEISASGGPVGEPASVSTGLDASMISVSGKGDTLAYADYRARQNVFRLSLSEDGPVRAEDATPVTFEEQMVETVDVHPEGAQLLYDSNISGNQDIYSRLIDGGEPVPLTTNPADDFAGAWSPDGTQIVFHSFRTGNRDLFLMSADGERDSLVQLTSDPGDDRVPHWSPDGLEIVFQSNRGGDFQVWKMSPQRSELDGGEPTPVSAGVGWNPVWSPDGRRIAYTGGPAGNLWVVAAAGGEARRLVSGFIDYPAWSADSKEVFFLRYGPDGSDDLGIWSVLAEGGGERKRMRVTDPRTAPSMVFTVVDEEVFFSMGTFEGDVSVRALSRR